MVCQRALFMRNKIDLNRQRTTFWSETRLYCFFFLLFTNFKYKLLKFSNKIFTFLNDNFIFFNNFKKSK